MLKKIVRIVLTGLIVYSLVRIGTYCASLYSADAEYADLKKDTTVSSTKSEEQKMDDYAYESLNSNLSVDFNKMRGEFSDFIGWLHIPDTKISYPVMYLESDNSFYLHHLPNGEKNIAGSLFLDGLSNGINSENLVIYGHNMKNGSMFGRLKKFTDKDFFESHPFIELHTTQGIRFYLIFSVRKVLKTDENTFTIDGLQTSTYIDNAIKENAFSYKTLTRDVPLAEIETHVQPQLITLSTCTGDSRYRLIVNGVRVK